MNFDDYMLALRSQREALLREFDRRWDYAFKDGSDLTALRAERQALLDVTDGMTDGDRAHLAAQWPAIGGFVLPAALRD